MEPNGKRDLPRTADWIYRVEPGRDRTPRIERGGDRRDDGDDRPDDRAGYDDRGPYATTGYAYGGGGDRDYGGDRGPRFGGGWQGEVLGAMGPDRAGPDRAGPDRAGPDRAGGHRGVGPIGYQRTDERVREDACEVLTCDDQVDASRIEVRVEGGEVTLSGQVPDRRTKRLAERCVEQVSGVKDVHNRLLIAARRESG